MVFNLATQTAAFALDDVEKIVPMARLERPQGLPAPLEGILNLGGAAVPVLRLDRLFRQPAIPARLYSMLIVLKNVAANRVAILVDRVSEILSVPESALVPVREEHCFNGCAQAIAAVPNGTIHVLSAARILLAQERELLAEFQQLAQERVGDWALEKQ